MAAGAAPRLEHYRIEWHRSDNALAAVAVWPAEMIADLEHVQEEIDHGHAHLHDEHHRHDHEGWEGPEPHSHPHRHAPDRHRHRFVIDAHHRRWPSPERPANRKRP